MLVSGFGSVFIFILKLKIYKCVGIFVIKYYWHALKSEKEPLSPIVLRILELYI